MQGGHGVGSSYATMCARRLHEIDHKVTFLFHNVSRAFRAGGLASRGFRLQESRTGLRAMTPIRTLNRNCACTVSLIAASLLLALGSASTAAA